MTKINEKEAGIGPFLKRYSNDANKAFLNFLSLPFLFFSFSAGIQNFKLKWKGPYQRSDSESRYPENMKDDTLRYKLGIKIEHRT